jgi:hypothetical protein
LQKRLPAGNAAPHWRQAKGKATRSASPPPPRRSEVTRGAAAVNVPRSPDERRRLAARHPGIAVAVIPHVALRAHAGYDATTLIARMSRRPLGGAISGGGRGGDPECRASCSCGLRRYARVARMSAAAWRRDIRGLPWQWSRMSRFALMRATTLQRPWPG